MTTDTRLREIEDVRRYLGEDITDSDRIQNMHKLIRLQALLIAELRAENEKMRTQLKRAEQLAGIAYDWDLGTDGEVEIDGQWVSCSNLRKDFHNALQPNEAKGGE